MRFVTFEDVADRFAGKTVAIVGSAPSVLLNAPGIIDSHEIVVRVQNYKLSKASGKRTDVHYAFYGSSVKNKKEDLIRDGVKLCMCKCPNGKPIESDWHERTGRQNGIDFRYIYEGRKHWWFCDTFVPTDEHFRQSFELLGKRIPTTGFSAIFDVLLCKPRSVYLTGFDFFTSGLHNVNERWRPGNPEDPIGHDPARERAWLKANLGNYPILLDPKLREILK